MTAQTEKFTGRTSWNEYETFSNAERRLDSESLEARVALHPFAAGMKATHLALLTSCAVATHFRNRQVILRAGEFANCFYLIESGAVSLESSAALDDQVRLETIGPVDLLGCSWMFPPYVWQFTARATAPVSALFFCGAILRAHCEKDPTLGYEFLKRVSAAMMQRMQAARQNMLALHSGRTALRATRSTATDD